MLEHIPETDGAKRGRPIMEPTAPLEVLYKVAAALLALLGLTVGMAFINMGRFNLVVALLIASAKAALVVLFFMEVRYSSRLTWIMAGAGLLWLTLLMGGTLADYITRATYGLPPIGNAVNPGTAVGLPTGDERVWRQANPADPRNSGNLGPAGGWTPREKDIAPSERAGTPGEPVPTSDRSR